jgi:hypothetical protein
MNKQRIWLAAIAGFGVLSVFLPWVSVMGLIGVTGLDIAQGWVALLLFGAALVIAFTGARAYALDSGRQGIVTVLGLAATGFGIWKYIEIKNGTVNIGGEIGRRIAREGGDAAGDLGKEVATGMMKMFGELVAIDFGIYCVIASGVALLVVALVKKRAA